MPDTSLCALALGSVRRCLRAELHGHTRGKAEKSKESSLRPGRQLPARQSVRLCRLRAQRRTITS